MRGIRRFGRKNQSAMTLASWYRRVVLYMAFTALSLLAIEPSVRDPHVRAMTAAIRAVIDHGVSRSPSLRQLIERLSYSDVVVYVYEEAPRSSLRDGRLTFLSKAGGRRYVQVRLVLRREKARNIATLAHELQHAVEIAERPWIVDEASLGRAYIHIGHATPSTDQAVHTFDTAAAGAMGRQVWREVITWRRGR
jgi:hypothetical protein